MRTEELRARLGYGRKLRFHLGMQCFFGLLKRERIRRRIYPTKDAARAAVFDYIEMFYNPNCRHGSTGDLSPIEFERRYAQRAS